MFQHILVPLDGSARAESVLPIAARLARATGGSLLLVHVISPAIDYSGGLAPIPMMTEQIIESEMTEATTFLKGIAARPELAGIPITTEVLFGIAALQILALATAYEIDLIVLCSHGRTGFTRWALGSVAHTLVHQSKIPVFVLREGDALALLANLDTSRSLRVLVPLDGSQLAEAALSPAVSLVTALAAPAQRALHLVQVVRATPAHVEAGVQRKENAEELLQARNSLATATEQVQTMMKGLQVALTTSVELAPDIASTLLSLAEHGGEEAQTGTSGKCDVIAISTHGRNGIDRWVMGSVTQRLLNAMKVPLLIVRPQYTV